MTYRKKRSNFKFKDYLPPMASQSQIDAINLAFMLAMEKLGVTDLRSYFERMRTPIVLCTVIGAVWGAWSNGLGGFFWGALAGVIAPAGLVWFAMVVCSCAVVLGAYFLAMAGIWFGFLWLVSRL